MRGFDKDLMARIIGGASLVLGLLLVFALVLTSAPQSSGEWEKGETSFIQGSLNSVSMVSSDEAWAVGGHGDILKWNGENWSKVESPTGKSLNSIDMLSSDEGWAVGDGGTILHWGGEKWVEVDSPTENSLYSIDMLSSDEGWAVGDWGTILHWDGSEWSRRKITPGEKLSFIHIMILEISSVSVVSEDEAWAVGSVVSGGNRIEANVILRWNGGDNWVPYRTRRAEGSSEWEFEPAEPLYAIEMVSPDEGWAGGRGKSILHWDGENWTRTRWPGVGSLRQITLSSPRDGWAVGQGGKMLHWNGENWTQARSPVGERLYSVDALSNDRAIAIGDHTILHWNGQKWRRAENTPVFCEPDLESVDTVSSDDAWAVGYEGNILHWNGKKWSKIKNLPDERLRSVDMVSSEEGWAVGYDGIILHYDGDEWSEAENPTEKSLKSIQMLSPDGGWAVGDGGIILHYNGGGGLRWGVRPILR